MHFQDETLLRFSWRNYSAKCALPFLVDMPLEMSRVGLARFFFRTLSLTQDLSQNATIGPRSGGRMEVATNLCLPCSIVWHGGIQYAHIEHEASGMFHLWSFSLTLSLQRFEDICRRPLTQSPGGEAFQGVCKHREEEKNKSVLVHH